MRVLVHGLVGTNLGGIETFLLNMNDQMSDDCIFDYIVEEKICIHEERIRRKGGRVFFVQSRAVNPIGNTMDIIRIYRQHINEYEIIYYNLSSLSWILPEIIGRSLGYRVVVHSHNAMLIDANSGFLHRTMNVLNKWVLSHMRITRLACSQYASEFMFGKQKSTIVYNGIDVDRYKFSESIRERIRLQYGIDSDTLVVGTVGRLAYQKNPLFTVEVFGEIHKKIPNSKLLMFGEGELRADIENRVQHMGLAEKVIMPGIVNNIDEVLNAMDMFLLPSRHEGLGIALIEAQANGLPCYTSENVVPTETRVTRLLNWISLDVDAKKWMEIIIDSLQYRETINEMREAYYYKIKSSNFNIESCAKSLELILNEKG